MRRARLALVLLAALVVLLAWRAWPRRAAAPVERAPGIAIERRAPPGAEAPSAAAEVAPPVVEAERAADVLAELRERQAGAGMGQIAIDVVDEEGREAPNAWVVPIDCGGLASGPPRLSYVEPGPCTVRAVRRDGALFARSEPVTVEVGLEDVAYVMLELASTRTGGIGVRFAPDDRGIRVVEVVAGSPADEAGLHPGDLVLDVGGVPTEGMAADTFVEHMTGAEDTDVTFTVGWSDDTGMVQETVTVVRRFLEG